MRVKNVAAVVAAIGGAGLAAPVQAGPLTDALGHCLVRSSSDADRTALMRWTFVAIAAHPGVRDLTAVSDTRRQEITRAAGRLFSRLITADCRAEAVAAIRGDGPGAIEQAFQMLGASASGDLMNSPAGAAVLTDIASHFDMEALDAILQEAAAAPRPVT